MKSAAPNPNHPNPKQEVIMPRCTTAFALAASAVLVLAGAATAQETAESAEEPLVVRLSFFMCDYGGNFEAIEEEIKTRDMPVWEALVQEEMVQDYGYLFHWWADEWNVGIYTIAETIEAVVEAEAEAQDRLEEQYGDDPTLFDQACPHHRDGFYQLGPNTGMEPPAAGGR